MDEERATKVVFTQRTVLVAACFAVAIVILVADFATGDYWTRGRVALPVGFIATHPHFGAALGGGLGAISGHFWRGALIGLLLPLAIFAFFMIFGQC